MTDSSLNPEGIPALPIGEVLAGISIPELPTGATPSEVLALIKLNEPDGGEGWSVRVTANLDPEEILGVLVGYVAHLTNESAHSWDDTDPTRATA